MLLRVIKMTTHSNYFSTPLHRVGGREGVNFGADLELISRNNWTYGVDNVEYLFIYDYLKTAVVIIK